MGRENENIVLKESPVPLPGFESAAQKRAPAVFIEVHIYIISSHSMHNIYPFLTPNVSAELGFLLMGFLSKAERALPAPHVPLWRQHVTAPLTWQPNHQHWSGKKPVLTADQPASQHTKH